MKEGTEGGWEEEGKREERKERERRMGELVGERKEPSHSGSHSKGRKLLRAEQDGILVANIYLTMIKNMFREAPSQIELKKVINCESWETQKSQKHKGMWLDSELVWRWPCLLWEQGVEGLRVTVGGTLLLKTTPTQSLNTEGSR